MSKKHVSEHSPVKIYPKPSLALVKSGEQSGTGNAPQHIGQLADGVWTLLNTNDEDSNRKASEAKKAIWDAAVKAAQLEASKYVHLLEVDRTVASFRLG